MGGAEAPPISLYKYNTFHRQKQEVLKPKKGVGCGKFWRRCVIIANLPAYTFETAQKRPFVLKKLPVVLFPHDSRAYKKSVLRTDEPTLRTPGKQIII